MLIKKKEVIISYTDVEMWAEYAAHSMKFVGALAQIHKLMKSPRKVTQQHIDDFAKRFKIVWNIDDTIEVVPI